MVQKQLSYKYQVYNELKKGILTGQYPPGSVMNERKLSEEMGISRTPVSYTHLLQRGYLRICSQ